VKNSEKSPKRASAKLIATEGIKVAGQRGGGAESLRRGGKEAVGLPDRFACPAGGVFHPWVDCREKHFPPGSFGGGKQQEGEYLIWGRR